ncbi:MAG: blue light sensor protein [Planktomarina sp.]|nr:blue light sensor protein [Planktomarina sp.]
MTRRKHSLIKQVIYVSKPVGFDEEILNSILTLSRFNNEKNQITGALICRSDLYLQYLEGPAHKIDSVYSKIKIDDRHEDVRLLEDGRSRRRLFSNWAMRGEPVKDWIWTEKEVSNGVLERLSGDDAMDIFIKHSREIDQFLS